VEGDARAARTHTSLITISPGLTRSTNTVRHWSGSARAGLHNRQTLEDLVQRRWSARGGSRPFRPGCKYRRLGWSAALARPTRYRCCVRGGVGIRPVPDECPDRLPEDENPPSSWRFRPKPSSRRSSNCLRLRAPIELPRSPAASAIASRRGLVVRLSHRRPPHPDARFSCMRGVSTRRARKDRGDECLARRRTRLSLGRLARPRPASGESSHAYVDGRSWPRTTTPSSRRPGNLRVLPTKKKIRLPRLRLSPGGVR